MFSAIAASLEDEQHRKNEAIQKSGLPTNIQTIVNSCIKALENATAIIEDNQKTSNLDTQVLHRILETLDKIDAAETQKQRVLQRIESELGA